MALSQLKIRLETSIPNAKMMELTKDLLVYDGKRFGEFSVYPFYDAYAEYPTDVIERLDYHKRLEIFFIESRFKYTVLGKQDVDRKQSQLNLLAKEKEYNALRKKFDDFDKAMKYAEKQEAWKDQWEAKDKELTDLKEEVLSLRQQFGQQSKENFEFTIRMILPTGFPANNFHPSMNYYQAELPKILSRKGTTPTVLSFFWKKNKKVFSYLKLNSEIYTIFQVIHINDVFNHPDYKTIINSFVQFTDPLQKKEDLNKWKEENEKATWEIVQAIMRQGWKIETIDSRNKEQEDFNKAIRKLETKISDNSNLLSYDYLQSHKEDVIKAGHADVYNLLHEVTKTTTDAKKKEKEHKLVSYDTLIKLQEIPSIKRNVDANIASYILIKDEFQAIIRNYNDAFSKRLIHSSLKNLDRYMAQMQKCMQTERAIEMIETKNTNYKNETDGEQLKLLIEKKDKNYAIYSKISEDFKKSRRVGNHWWADMLNDPDNDVEEFINDIQKCKEEKSQACIEKITVHLDELLQTGKKERLYDAVLSVNVVEGKLTPQNVSANAVNCSFLNNMLGSMYRHLKNRNKDNVPQKIFFSLKSVLELTDKKNVTKRSLKPQKGTRKIT